MADSHPPVQQECQLHNHDYGQQLLERLHKFWVDETFCDYTLQVEDQEIKVHRAILAGCSDYFNAMFFHDVKETQDARVDLPSLSLCGVRHLLDYAYTGKLFLSLDVVEDVLAAATFLQITTAIDLCLEFLKKSITFDNSESLISLSNMYNLTSLATYYREMILENFLDFADTETFLKLDADILSNYLLEDSLRCPSEGKLLQKVLKWYNYDRENRKLLIFNVLEKVRYTIDGWSTINYALEQEPYTSDPECQKLLDWSKKFMYQILEKPIHYSHRTRVRFEKKTIVCIGGITVPLYGVPATGFSGENQYYHHKFHSWFPLGSIHFTEPRSHCPLVEVNNDYGVLVGGFIYKGLHRRFTKEVKIFISSGLHMLDWPCLQEERAYHVAVYLPGKDANRLKGSIYAIGGRNEKRCLRSVERYDLGSKKWKFVQWLEKALYSHAVATYKSKIYISGGIEKTVTNRVQLYTGESNTWKEEIPMLTARCEHTMSEVAGMLIVCGGRAGARLDGSILALVEVFDTELKQWSFVGCMPVPLCNMTAVVLEGKLLIVGGEEPDDFITGDIKEYNIDIGQWREYAVLPFPKKNASCAAITIKQSPDGRESDYGEENYTGLLEQSDSDDY